MLGKPVAGKVTVPGHGIQPLPCVAPQRSQKMYQTPTSHSPRARTLFMKYNIKDYT